MAVRYSRIKKQLRRSLAPTDPGKYTVRETPEERFYFRFRLVLAGIAVFFGVLVLPIGQPGHQRGWRINTTSLKRYVKLLPDERVLIAYINYLKGRL